MNSLRDYPEALMQTDIPDFPVKRGKARDIIDMGNDTLVMVTTDRISAFDVVLEDGIPNKGKVLNGMTVYWNGLLLQNVPDLETHFITDDVTEYGPGLQKYRNQLEGRSMLVRKTDVLPAECIARGYITGSAYKSYAKDGTMNGIKLPEGLKDGSKLDQLYFTPSTKAELGKHDENITMQQLIDLVGDETAWKMYRQTLGVYGSMADHAIQNGIIIADTKTEWGTRGGTRKLILIDEYGTPDSSRFWPADQHSPGRSQPSYDKQFVRDWLETQKEWKKTAPAPRLPEEIITQTSDKYLEAYSRLTGKPLAA